jgi:hypothetical protein
MNQPTPLQSRERARKAFKREHDEIWNAVAGDAEKTAAVRAILVRCDAVRDQMIAHYGRRKEALIAREIAKITAKQDRPKPELKPNNQGRTSRDIKQQAINTVANRQRGRLRHLNEIERNMLHREVMHRDPSRRPVKERGYLITERNARVLDAVDRAQKLRNKARRSFNATRDQKIARAQERGAANPAAEVGFQQAMRLRRIDKAERSVISQTLNQSSFNRVSQARATPSMSM